MSNQTVLVAIDCDATRRFLTDNLTADGYDVLHAGDVPTALALLARHPLAVVCDLNGETLGVVDAIRGEQAGPDVDPDVPLLLLARHHDTLERARAYERGADDYMSKPFAYPELRTRVARLVARAKSATRHHVNLGALRIDVDARRVTVDGHVLTLTGMEYRLLLTLASVPQRVFTKQELLRDVWGFEAPGATRTLDSHACRLRQKLAAVGASGLIVNVWGVGYRLSDSPAGERQVA